MELALSTFETQRTQLLAKPVPVIKTPEDLQRASEILAQYRTFRKNVEVARKKLVKPFDDRIANINQEIKALLQPIIDTEILADQALRVYRAAEDARVKQEQAQLQAQANANFDAKTSLIPEPVADIAKPAVSRIKTAVGDVGFMTEWKWGVTDRGLIPSEYWILDTITIGRLVKGGVRDIPGLRIYPIKIPTVREEVHCAASRQ